MDEYDPARYGRAVKGQYDLLYPVEPAVTRGAADLITELARRLPEPSFLEFGIGTGRIALDVQSRGVRVAGIDGSESMVAQLRAKPGAETPEVVIGDYRDARVPGRYSVVALVFNGIFDPRGLDAQLDIFRNAARHLVPGGFFVVESWVMSEQQRDGNWSVMPRFVSDGHVELQLARYDLDTNHIERTLMHIRGEGTDFVSVEDTYASPGELDIIAHVTGFERVRRYGGWNREPFSVTSTNQVSVFRLRDVGESPSQH